MAISNSKFEVRRNGQGTISGLLPAIAVPIGTAFMYGAKDPDTGENTFQLAQGRADGFVTKDVRTTEGMSDTELANEAVGLMAGDGGDFQGHFVAGKSGSIELPRELEVEGDDYVMGSGTGAITTGTAVDSKLSFRNGKFTVAQSGERAQYRLVKQMTAQVTSGATRIYVQEIEGYVV